MTILTVNPGQVAKKLFLIDFTHVLLVGQNMHDGNKELGLVLNFICWNCWHKNVQ